MGAQLSEIRRARRASRLATYSRRHRYWQSHPDHLGCEFRQPDNLSFERSESLRAQANHTAEESRTFGSVRVDAVDDRGENALKCSPWPSLRTLFLCARERAANPARCLAAVKGAHRSGDRGEARERHPDRRLQVRGGIVYFDRLKRERPQVRGIVTATRGNHGQSLAFAGARAGVAATLAPLATRRTETPRRARWRRSDRNTGATLTRRGSERCDSRPNDSSNMFPHSIESCPGSRNVRARAIHCCR